MSFPPLTSPDGDLSDADVRRHVHQLIHPDLAATGQRRLRNSRVLVVGADEVGGPAVGLLADAGVGRLGIVDGAPLHVWNPYPVRPRPAGVEPAGRTRAAAWTTALRDSHPDLTVVTHEVRPAAATATELVSGYDVVLCATEDPALCYLLDDVCARLGKPFVWGDLNRSDGRVSVFWEPHGPTYRDLFPTPPTPHFRGMHGVLGVLGAWLAAAMVAETMKLITGRGEPLVGRVMEYDLLGGVTRVTPLSRNPETGRPAELVDEEPYFGLLSPAAAEAARDSTISVTELKELLDSGAPVQLVDVREPEEHEVVHLPDSVLLPVGEFLEGDAAATLPRDRKVVLYCRMGVRSAEALAVVKAHDHADAVHVGGGIIAWGEQIDRSLPRY
jgi:molybdopterin/thiamine biosynthesis adenylyltransferase/rhodanese-related sulfurtransferase